MGPEKGGPGWGGGELRLVRTTTGYCRFGSEARKSTVIAVSPVLTQRGTPWVARCTPSGACGSLLATGSATKHVARPSNTLMDTAVPGGICSALIPDVGGPPLGTTA